MSLGEIGLALMLITGILLVWLHGYYLGHAHGQREERLETLRSLAHTVIYLSSEEEKPGAGIELPT